MSKAAGYLIYAKAPIRDNNPRVKEQPVNTAWTRPIYSVDDYINAFKKGTVEFSPPAGVVLEQEYFNGIKLPNGIVIRDIEIYGEGPSGRISSDARIIKRIKDAIENRSWAQEVLTGKPQAGEKLNLMSP